MPPPVLWIHVFCKSITYEERLLFIHYMMGFWLLLVDSCLLMMKYAASLGLEGSGGEPVLGGMVVVHHFVANAG